MIQHRLSPLFDPRSLVVVASQPLFVLEQLTPRLRAATTVASFDPAGKLQLPELTGVAPEQRIDLALIAVNAEQVTQTLAQLATVRPRAMVLYGLAPQAVADGAFEWAHDNDCILLGPHSFGLQRPGVGFNASLHPSVALPGKVAFITQSHAILSAVMDWAEDTHTAFSLTADLGDRSNITIADLLDFLAFDPRTSSIAIYLDQVHDAPQFISALRAAASVKPVVVLKSGRNAPPAAPTDLPPDTVFDAALRRAGALRVHYFVQLFSTLKALSHLSRPRGRRLALVANGYGPIQLVHDVVWRQSFITPAVLANDTKLRLQARLSDYATVGNPLIEPAPFAAQTVSDILRDLVADDGIDGVLVLLTPDPRTDMAAITEQLRGMVPKARKPIVVCMMGDATMRAFRHQLTGAGVPSFRTPETAVDAFGQLARFHYNQQLLLQTQPPGPVTLSPDLDTAEAIVNEARQRLSLTLPPTSTRQLLSAFGITARFAPHPVKPAEPRSLKVRVLRDALFGAVMSLEETGAWPNDSSKGVELLPLNAFLARSLIERSAAWQHARLKDAPTPMLDQLEDLLVAVSEMAVALPALHTIELNPVQVLDNGVHILNASITLAPAEPVNSLPHLAIAPYPVNWVQQCRFADGAPWTLRPIRPEDAEALQTFVRSLSNEARYMRFVSAMRELPPRMLARYTQIDYRRELALIATVEQPNPQHRNHPHEVIVGLAHYLLNADGIGAEYALVISDQWQRRGLGSTLMNALITAAREQGLYYLEGLVLAGNRPMLGLMTSLGFTNDPTDDDPGMRRVWLGL